jgi:hypothetical protein
VKIILVYSLSLSLYLSKKNSLFTFLSETSLNFRNELRKKSTFGQTKLLKLICFQLLFSGLVINFILFKYRSSFQLWKWKHKKIFFIILNPVVKLILLEAVFFPKVCFDIKIVHHNKRNILTMNNFYEFKNEPLKTSKPTFISENKMPKCLTIHFQTLFTVHWWIEFKNRW